MKFGNSKDIVERLKAYSVDGDIDLREVISDVIVMVKAKGATRAMFIKVLGDLWDTTHVTITKNDQ
jgi:hypothetical protein